MFRKLFLGACLALVLGLTLAEPANAGLVAWWRFDDGSGTTALDSSSNGNDGIITGNPQWVTGRLGGALDFSGTNSRVTAPHIPLDNRSFTIAMWVNLGQNTSEHIAFSQGPGSTNNGLHLRLGGSGNPPAGGINFGFYSNDLVTGGGLLELNTWYHLGFVYDIDAQQKRIYVDGTLVDEGTSTPFLGTTQDTLIGSWNSDQWFEGIIDDVQVYDHALTDNEILAAMQGLEGYPYATNPIPEDGSLYSNIWVSLGWGAGDFAVSHDVYFGENFDDVNDATRDSDVYRGNQDLNTTFYIAGFAPYAYPDGLVNGMTYYWRIDEVNDADPNSPWKGRVWSFTIPPNKAYNPVPSDNATYIDSKSVTLSWTAGFGSKLHYIYFGDDYDTVANDTGATPTAMTTYKLGSLELEKTYYWKVDESDGVNTYTGDVWSFRTAKEGGGLKGEYFNNTNLSGVPVLTRVDPQIDVYWNPGPVGTGVNEDNFSVRWTGEIEAPFSEPFTFIIGCDDGARMYLNSELIIDDWNTSGHDYTEFRSQPIDLVEGEHYSIIVEGFELTGEAEWRLFWASPSMARQNVPQAAFTPPIRASNPSPPSGATGTKMTPILSWSAGDYAVSHEVYFGTDADAVANADKSSPEYKGTKALGDESYDPGKLAWFTQYFWRIDEVNDTNPDSPWIGNLWNFTTGDFIVVDDFEDYDIGNNEIWWSWKDGLGYAPHDNEPAYPGNGTGSAVGDETTNSYTEETIVHSGRQSMPFEFNNNKQGYAFYSETEKKLINTRDWTEEGVAILSLWFRGYAASVGSFVEGPVGTYTMTGSGTDIESTADEFHFAYKMLNGIGSIVARVESVDNTNTWAKAGVMIRETLEPGSKQAMMVVTPGSGISFQRRVETDDTTSNTTTGGIVAPYWVKIERDLAGNFTGYSSFDGSTWDLLDIENIPMDINTYIGLALTSHDATLTCEAVFTNVTTTGNVTGQWINQDIGIESNDAESLYVAVSNSTGTPAVVVHDDPAATQIDTWTEWVIPLQVFADEGIIPTDVDRIAIGLGTKGNVTVPGGSGKIFIDDIRLYQPAPEPEPEPEPEL